jgi:FKBP-type peptidyl-prolyl cis-trans isomerase FkpA
VKLARLFQLAASLTAISVCAGAVTGCDGSPTAPSGAGVYSQTDLREGTGAEAINGSVVTVQYTGWFYDAAQPNQKGVPFDSSVGGTGFTFALGTGSVIAGWDQGIVGMKEGGLRRLVVPPSLGYGATRYQLIPANSTLVFEIELVTVNVAPTVTTQPSDRTVKAGQTATFTAAASGTPTPTVQWQVSSNGGSTWTNLTNAAPYGEVTTTTLTVTPVTTALNGAQYRAAFTNIMSTATTNAATLTVQ